MKVLLFLCLLSGLVWSKPLQLITPQEKLTAAEAAALRKGLDVILAFYGKLGFRPPDSLPLRIFPTRQEFDSWRISHSGSTSTSGYFSPQYGEVVTYRSRRLTKTLIHEGNHAIFWHVYIDPPTWLNEGLSEQFEEMDLSSPLVEFPPHPLYARRLKGLPENQIGKDILQVVNMDYATYHQAGLESHNYARAWGLVHFLWKRGSLERLIPKLLRKAPGEDDLSTLHRAYLGGLPALERELESFYRSEPDH